MKKRAEHSNSHARAENVPMPPPDPALADQIAQSSQHLACRICGSRGAVRADEMLCWVCRRLKISAWRDVEKLGAPE